MIHTHQTAPTQFVEANGIRFAYRRFGKTGGVPIVFNQHYIGTMDYWDPTVTDGLARDREVILFNNAGVSSSSGEVPATFEEMGADAIAFIRALGLKRVDVLGFSIGGMVAQEITLQAPDLVRRLIVDGTGPRGGQGMESLTQAAGRLFGAAYDPPEHVWLAVKFSPSAAGQAAGRGFLKGTHLRGGGGRPARGVLRLSEDDQAANTRRERQQRRDHAHGELFHHAATHPVRGADHLPRLQSRRAPPIPGALR